MMEQVPLSEITCRGVALQKALAENNFDLALVRQVSDLFYYTGTIVDGFLALSPRAHPLLLVRRPKRRAAA
ncbi:MAG TPA: aminopeptidase P family N-terminal domain-containing protein, partial [Desulfobaccales bacterium]